MKKANKIKKSSKKSKPAKKAKRVAKRSAKKAVKVVKAETLSTVFGRNLLNRLGKIKMSQAELARQTKLTPSAICMIVAGQREPSLTTVIKILTSTKTDLNRLVLP